ncbi:MAG: hypothetical protein K6L76_08595 [Agarilytica sp.]
MKRAKTKAEIRDEIDRAIGQFIEKGGAVQDIPSGISGREDNSNIFGNATAFEPKKPRTPVTEAVQALEERKSSKHKPESKPKSGPRKKLITDDFGEPVRWVWEDK